MAVHSIDAGKLSHELPARQLHHAFCILLAPCALLGCFTAHSWPQCVSEGLLHSGRINKQLCQHIRGSLPKAPPSFWCPPVKLPQSPCGMQRYWPGIGMWRCVLWVDSVIWCFVCFVVKLCVHGRRCLLRTMLLQPRSSCLRPCMLLISNSLTMFAQPSCSSACPHFSARSCRMQSAHRQYPNLVG